MIMRRIILIIAIIGIIVLITVVVALGIPSCQRKPISVSMEESLTQTGTETPASQEAEATSFHFGGGSSRGHGASGKW